MHRACLLLLMAGLCLHFPAAAAANSPVITQQPASITTTVGQPVTFTVTATGEGLSFQWRRDGTLIPGATNASYSMARVAAGDNGATFDVVIGDAGGSSTNSAVATLTVLADSIAPFLRRATNTPTLRQVRVHFSERMEEAFAGRVTNYVFTPAVTVTKAVLDHTGSNVTLAVWPGLQEGQTYTLEVLNQSDLASNVLHTTQVNFQAAIAPRIVTQPQSRSIAPGTTVGLFVSVTGTEPLFYQWYRNHTPLLNATASALQLAGLASDVGGYRVVISNAAGVVTSAVATISFEGTYTVGLPVGFSFVTKQLANDAPSFPVPDVAMTLYQWNVALQQFSTFSYLPAVGWTPQAPVVALGEGVVVSVVEATSLTFTGVRGPLEPATLEEGFNLRGAPVPARATYGQIFGPPEEGSTVFRLRPGRNALLLNDANYRIDYYRDGVWHDSPAPELRVGEAAFFTHVTPVAITKQPAPQLDRDLGLAAQFSVSVTGTPPFKFQWRLNGQNIPGATNELYTIAAVTPAHAGIYSVSVGNLVGDVVSTGAPLTVATSTLAMADDFSAAPTVTNAAGLVSTQNRNATTENGEPPHGGKRTDASVWLTWIAPATGIVTMTAEGSSFDAVLSVYLGSNLSSLALLDASDDDAGYGSGRIRFNARAGTSYRVCVSGLADSRGDILLGWNLEPTTDQLPEIIMPPQDVTVRPGDTAQFVVNATSDNEMAYTWFRDGFPLPDETGASLSITNVSDEDVGTYAVRIASANRVRFSATASLQIENPGPGLPLTGARATPKLFDVKVPGATAAAPKASQPKFGTVNHGYSGSQTVSSIGAGKDPGEPNHCGVTGGNSIWYVIRATNNGTMFINTDGSSFDTVLAVYTAPPVITSYTQLVSVVCDNNSGLDGLDSRTSFAATSNTIYYVAVDGVGGASGTVKIAFKLVLPLNLTNLVYTNVADGKFTMRVDGTPTLPATIEFTTNLNVGIWSPLTNASAPSGSFNFTNVNAGPSNRIYRALNSF